MASPCVRPVPVLCLVSLMRFLFSDSFGITINARTLQQFWNHAREHFEWGAMHPGRDTCIPVALYGDGARYTNSSGFTEKVLCLILNFPLWAPKSTRTSRFLVFAVRESLMVSYKTTIWPIYKHLCDQLNLLFRDGVCFNDGTHLKFCLTELRGDCERRLGVARQCFESEATLVQQRDLLQVPCNEDGWRFGLHRFLRRRSMGRQPLFPHRVHQ